MYRLNFLKACARTNGKQTLLTRHEIDLILGNVRQWKTFSGSDLRYFVIRSKK
jgi:hypothetical protein